MFGRLLVRKRKLDRNRNVLIIRLQDHKNARHCFRVRNLPNWPNLRYSTMDHRFVFQSLFAFAVGLALFSCGLSETGVAQETAPPPAATQESPSLTPRVLGYGVDTFAVGQELFRTDFSDESQWTIQVEENDEPMKEHVKFHDGMLDLYMPARGCTAWLKQKFSGPITITYQVKCPLETIKFPEIQSRDINNFWHCSGVENETDIFDSKSFNGGFGSYMKLQGWYASTGGGGRKGNRTTRFRRYPRETDGEPCLHIALNSNDDKPEFLITPGKWHTVQLVAFGDLIQYILDGKVVYQIRKGDQVSVEVPAEKPDGKKTSEKQIFDTDKFSVHTEGYFGFRMTRSHHQYRNLVVHRLDAVSR